MYLAYMPGAFWVLYNPHIGHGGGANIVSMVQIKKQRHREPEEDGA